MPQNPCNGGPSGPINANQKIAVLGAAAVEALSAFLDPALALVLAPFIASVAWDTNSICGSPPPSDPILTQQDALDILNFADPAVSGPALAKLNQWFLSWYWYAICRCTNVATPAAPAPSNPGAIVGINAGAPSAPPQAPCWNVTQQVVGGTSVTGPGGWEPAQLAPNYIVADAPSTVFTLPQPLPSLVSLSVSDDGQGTNPSNDYWCRIVFRDVNHTTLLIVTSTEGGPPTKRTASATPPAGSVDCVLQWTFNYAISSPPFTGLATLNLTIYCAGQSALNPGTPCCPPDPTLELRLNQILGLVQALYAGQVVPVKSYAESTVHAGLAGNGSFLIGAATIAVKVTLTTIPAHIGIAAGDPQVYFDAGFITPIAAEAPLQGQRILFSPQLFTLPAITEQIGYTLLGGVQATITELVAGP